MTTSPQPATGPVGSEFRDEATLSGGSSPTGTITFRLYGPDDPGCAGPPAFSDTVAVSGNGTYSSAGFTPTQAGNYEWTADYSGDADNHPAGSSCGQEPITVPKASPTLTTSPQPAAGPAGSEFRDEATLSGGVDPTGTITFRLYGPEHPTCLGPALFTDTVTVTGNGTYTSAGFTPTQAGTYQWTAEYSGDAKNTPAGSGCGVEPLVVTRASPALTTSPQPLIGSAGSEFRDEATLSGGSSPTGTITFRLYGPDDPTCQGPAVFTDTVTVSGNSTYSSVGFSPTQAGAYEWTADYSGDANNDPASSACGQEPVVVTKAGPTLTTSPQPVTGQAGSEFRDEATLSGGVGPAGTITFRLYGPGDPGCLGPPAFTDVVAVAGNGTYSSAPFTLTQAGAYEWTAEYSGDDNNDPASSACGLEPIVVTEVARIVFASSRTGNGDIYTVDPAGGAPTQLTSGDAVDSEPAWSPDRNKIAFTSTRDGNVEIYVMDADGSDVTRLTTHPKTDASPAWYGTRIAFASNRARGNWDIYVMDAADGGNVTRLTTHRAADTFPTWSPAGTKLAFSSARTAGGDIYSMNGDGTLQTRLTTTSGADTEPDWFGSTIAFATNRHGSANYEIYTMDDNGTAQTRRTMQAGHDVSPTWSPDGAKLAFATSRTGNFELFTMNADGSAPAQVTMHPAFDVFPDW